MRVSVGQFTPTGNVNENLDTISALAGQAEQANAGLLVLPEEAMLAIAAAKRTLDTAVEHAWPVFEAGLSSIARKHHVGIIAGGYEPSDDARPYNTLLAFNSNGERLGTYRKLHLYDAFSYQESKLIRPGNSGIKVVEIGDLKVGLMTCYDVRFPEMARALADAGADLIALGAAWYRGDHKVEHWETLLKARAIENTVWIAAAGTITDHTIGHSAIIDPMGSAIDFLDEQGPEIATVQVNPERIEEVRSFLPVLRNRRFAKNKEILSRV